MRGFFHWTGVDNYEWNHGFDVQFGCFTRDREPRGSAELLATYARATEADASAAGAVGRAGADGVLVEPLGEVQTFEHELDAGRDAGGRLADVEVGEHRADAVELTRAVRRYVGRGNVFAGVHDRAASNDATIGPSFSGRTRARNTSRTAAFMMRSSTWPSRPSSSVSISILPVVDDASASRSETRGTTSRSPLISARRVAFATNVS